MKLTLKLPLAFGGAMLLMLAAALFGLLALNTSIDTYATTVQAGHRQAAAASALHSAFKTQVQEWKNTLLRGKDAKSLDRHWSAFGRVEKDIENTTGRLVTSLPQGEARVLLERFGEAHRKMGEQYRRAYAEFGAAGFDAVAGDKAVQGLDREPARLIEEASAKLSAQSEALSAAAEVQAERATRVSVALMAGVFVLGVIGCVVFSRTITRPIGRAVAVAQAVAEGDLTVDVQAPGRDEVAQLLGALARMQAQLSRVVQDVRNNAESVSTASAQIAQGNADLSQRTEEQASSLQQTAATMEQLGSAARNNTENARQANDLAQGASSVAARGGEVVAQVVDTMKGISDSSRQIADIISVIDGIAFQTNILALNAAVEAARAGEQGRGFAVVAGEVRGLAQRCAEAAREVRGLITASVERVGQGTALVDRAGQTMQEVVDSVRRVSHIVGEISAASQEQSAGVQQAGQAVGQMDQVTQQNAALVEQSAAAAESLRHQAAALVRAVGVFKVG